MRKPPKNNLLLTRAYKIAHDECELHMHLKGEAWEKIERSWLGFLGISRMELLDPELLHLHHIHGGCHRWDIKPNIIHISPAAHEYCHKFLDHGRIVCQWVKAHKGEFKRKGRELMRLCMGFDPIGRLESYEVTEEWVENLRLDLYERF
jgi:hypothetical protein